MAKLKRKRKSSARVRDPAHKRLLKGLGKHFAKDEAAGRRKRRGRRPPRGKVPPQLRPYLFKKGKRRINPRRGKKRGKRVERTTTRSVITRVRKVNPARTVYALVAKAPGRKLLRFTGEKFSNHGHAKIFGTVTAIKAKARELRRRYGPVLRHYGLFAEPRRVK